MEILLFYIPFSASADASVAGQKAIEQRLAACAHVFPIHSIFPWDGQLQTEQESILLLKTIPALKEKIQSFIAALHPYEIPAILSWSAEVNESYGVWMLEQIGQEA